MTREWRLEGVSDGLDVAGRGGRGANDIRGSEAIVLKVGRRSGLGMWRAEQMPTKALFGNSRPSALLTCIDVTLYVCPMGLNYKSATIRYISRSKVRGCWNGPRFSQRLARYIQTDPN